jgi:hypothetical protein
MSRRNRRASRPLITPRCLHCPALLRHAEGLLCRRCQDTQDRQVQPVTVKR